MSMTRASLWHYRAIHALVAVGIAVAVAVLAGALLVGASVRASLRDLALQRLGAADIAISTATSVSARLGAAMVMAAPDVIRQAASLVATTGTAAHADSGRTASRVQVYGVDEAFWAFHGVQPVTLSAREAAISEGLARELGASDGDAIVLRVSGPSEIPLGTLQGRRDDGGARLRVTVARALGAARMGEFSLVPGQGPVHAVFVPLALLQRALNMPARVNTTLLQLAPRDGSATPATVPLAAVTRAWLASASLPDHGLRVRRVPGDRVMALEGLGGFISPDVVARVQQALARVNRPGVPALTYVANAIRIGDRTTPYSTVTAVDVDGYNRLSVPTGPPAPGTDAMSDGDPLVRGALEVRVGRGGTRVGRVQVTEAPPRPGAQARRAREPSRAPEAAEPPTDGHLWLNEWAADDLDAHVGDTVRLEYFVWTDEGGLESRSASFALRGILPMMRIGGDRTLTPDYPGITDAPDLTAWDPPFPVDLSMVRRKDEAYWDQWRGAPKAFVPLEVGQRLWGSRFGSVSSIRFALRDVDAVTAAVRAEMSSQVVARAVRAEALAAAEGTTDFGEYFLYFSFFLVVSALLIAYLFFALGVEQRARDVGLLAAVGYTPRDVRAMFLREGTIVAAAGAALGVAGAIGYAAAIMVGLRTWWVDAVGTTALSLHVDPVALAAGVAGAAAAALAALWMGTRALARHSPRSLLLGGAAESSPGHAVPSLRAGLAVLAIAALLVVATIRAWLGSTPGFFGAGGALLVGGLLLARAWLLGSRGHAGGRGRVWALGRSHTRWRPARTTLTLSLIAFATFVLVSVVAFRRDASDTSLDRDGGTGGFALMAESAVPLMHDPNTAAGRDALGLDPSVTGLEGIAVTRLRLRPGDEASCLTLYRPRNPRIVGVNPAHMAGRFPFADAGMAAAGTSPWTLLDQPLEDGAVPAIADQTTLTYVLHLGVGDTFTFAPDGLSPVTFRIVAALADSVLQSELIIGEQGFVRLFPRHEGYRVWLVETAEARAAEVAAMLEDRLADAGVDVVDTRERLAAYHRVENTYLATFQALGALGLLLGTLGVGAVLARNVLERQREWALLRAVGYRGSHLSIMVLAESAALVGGGVLLGASAAALAIAPAIAQRGQALPLGALGAVLAAVAVAGLLSSLVALALATRVPVVSAIRSE
ncbi:MAG: FtsX-like permease family protein [Acidobacteria bacterium]|nr:FtsX-like permease family protein [Acidobacteriota bacterium]